MKYLLPLLCLMATGSWAAATDAPAGAPLVMLISVDGMKPEAIIDAQKHGLKVPNLRAFMADGVSASGVRGVLPTLTYPSHTTC
jgi:predicted AlkP superfamily pyrophosphatase or phosphodiesterase